MKRELRRSNILAIESAVGDGSLAIIRQGKVAASHSGDGSSRAERLIPLIHDSVKMAGLVIRDIDLIAVSVGPGSYSGIRIGMSTALGLHNAIGIACVGVPVLDAMANAAESVGPVICAVPVGKHDAAWQQFGHSSEACRRESLSDAQICPVSDLMSEIARRGDLALYAYPSLFDRVSADDRNEVRILNAGDALAELIGLYAADGEPDKNSMTPIYIRNREPEARSI